MLIVTYDISNTKLRSKFSRFLEKFGHRLQFSVFEIKNSPRILKQIQLKISHFFEKKFTENDSIIIFDLSATCKITRYGNAKNTEKPLHII